MGVPIATAKRFEAKLEEVRREAFLAGYNLGRRPAKSIEKQYFPEVIEQEARIKQLEDGLLTVLNCYADRQPTNTDEVEAVYKLINWERSK